MKRVNLAIVGATGMVGRTFLKVLEERKFPINNLYLFSSEKSDYTCIDWHHFRRGISRCDLFPLLLFSCGIWTHYRTFSMGVLRIG